jgi:DHA2 family methylenomycin A resistance protein-like MFS transporter
MRGHRLELAALSVGAFLWILDAMVVTVALVDIKRDLQLDAAALQWMVDAYAVSLASLLLAAGVVADRIGARTVYLAGLAGFAAASAGCALAPAAELLIAARALQGAAVAAMLVGSLALLRATFPGSVLRARAIGAWAAVSGVAGIVGPVIGGLLVDSGGWRLAFAIDVPICIAGILLSLRISPAPVRTPVQEFPISAHALLAIATAGIVLLVIEWPHRTPGDPLMLAGAVAAACALFRVLASRERLYHLVAPGFISRPTVTATTAVALLHNFGGYGAVFVLSIYLQGARGWSALDTGVALTPMPLAMTLVSLIVGGLLARVGARALLGLGMAVGAFSTAIFAGLSSSSSYLAVALPIAGIGVAGGMSVPSMTAVMLGSVAEEQAGIAGAALSAARQLGTALGVAAVGSVASAGGARNAGFSAAMAVAASAFAAGSAIAIRYGKRAA